ncbi:hypothetical protein KCU85_g4325, partial [Aureobasidium melanogenum]
MGPPTSMPPYSSSQSPLVQVRDANPVELLVATFVANNKRLCFFLLNGYPESILEPGNGFEWLREPVESGLTRGEIMSLILEEKEQSPWICYDLRSRSPARNEVSFYRPDYPQPVQQSHDHYSAAPAIRRITAELCGLGGIIPTRSNRAAWIDNAIVSSDDRSAKVSYWPVDYSSNSVQWIREVFGRCIMALHRLLDLFGWLQTTGLIRDHLIVLRLIKNGSGVHAQQITLGRIVELKHSLVEINTPGAQGVSEAELARLYDATNSILSSVSDNLEVATPVMVEWTVNSCALAVQVLAVAMLSLSQAHLGEIDPFFLEHSLAQISLYGSRSLAGSPAPRLKLVNLTCVGDMVNSRVMAFTDVSSSAYDPSEAAPASLSGLLSRMKDTQTSQEGSTQAGGLYDLIITPRDIFDLWGAGVSVPVKYPEPGTFAPDEWSRGLEIRGGTIYKPSAHSEKMHWRAGNIDDAYSGIPFKLDTTTPMTIGAVQVVNQSCPIKPGPSNTVSRETIRNHIAELGTWPETWRLQEQQYGFQAGQYLSLTVNGTMIRQDALTLK